MSLTTQRSPFSGIMNVTNSERALKSYCKSKGYEKPVYRVTSRSSTLLDGRVYRFKHYRCAVSVNGFTLAEGDGFSKRIARKKAAMVSLQHLRVYELQNFWSVYQTILPQGLIKSGQGGSTNVSNQLTANRKLMVTGSGVEIEELLPTGGIMTPQSLFRGLPVQNQEVPVTKKATKERSDSVDSSNELINAAIEKLRNYTDDVEATWKSGEKEDGDDDDRFTEHPNECQVQEFISVVAYEIENADEKERSNTNL